MRLRTFLLAVLLPLAAAGAHAQGAVRDEVLRNMTPQQRENLWQSMTPEQRAGFWRRLTPEQRQAIRQQMPLEQREAMRQRMLEQRERGTPPGGPPGERILPPGAPARDGAAPPPHGGHEFGPRRLSPEERQKLREQVIESTRDLREDRRPRMGMERRRGRDR